MIFDLIELFKRNKKGYTIGCVCAESNFGRKEFVKYFDRITRHSKCDVSEFLLRGAHNGCIVALIFAAFKQHV